MQPGQGVCPRMVFKQPGHGVNVLVGVDMAVLGAMFSIHLELVWYVSTMLSLRRCAASVLFIPCCLWCLLRWCVLFFLLPLLKYPSVSRSEFNCWHWDFGWWCPMIIFVWCCNIFFFHWYKRLYFWKNHCWCCPKCCIAMLVSFIAIAMLYLVMMFLFFLLSWNSSCRLIRVYWRWHLEFLVVDVGVDPLLSSVKFWWLNTCVCWSHVLTLNCKCNTEMSCHMCFSHRCRNMLRHQKVLMLSRSHPFAWMITILHVKRWLSRSPKKFFLSLQSFTSVYSLFVCNSSRCMLYSFSPE